MMHCVALQLVQLNGSNIPQEDVAEAATIVETLRPSFQAAIDQAKA
jgi:hypothetical protein